MEYKKRALLYGTTSIGTFTVSDPEYDSSVKCRLSKRLPKNYQWNVEIHVGTASWDSMTDDTLITIYILRQDNKYPRELITKREYDSFVRESAVSISSGEIGVDTAAFCINDVQISTLSDGKFGDFHILSMQKEIKPFDKELVGIFCLLTFSSECTTEYGWNLANDDEVKQMFEHIFKTSLETVTQ